MPRVDYEKLSDRRLGEPTATIQARVETAEALQRERFNGRKADILEDETSTTLSVKIQPLTCNADMIPAEVRQFCDLDDPCRALMKTAMSVHAKHAIQLSARAYHRVLKLARTIADLAGAERIGPSHLAKAFNTAPGSILSDPFRFQQEKKRWPASGEGAAVQAERDGELTTDFAAKTPNTDFTE